MNAPPGNLRQTPVFCDCNACTVGNCPRCTPTGNFHVDFKVSCLCDFMTELCSLKAEAIQNHKNTNVGQGEFQLRNLRVIFGGGQGYDGYVTKTVVVCKM